MYTKYWHETNLSGDLYNFKHGIRFIFKYFTFKFSDIIFSYTHFYCSTKQIVNYEHFINWALMILLQRKLLIQLLSK